MKRSLYLFVLFLHAVLAPALGQIDFSYADSLAKAFKSEHTDARLLARELTAPLSTPVEKARAIFTWIAHNIRYDCKKFHENEGEFAIEGYSEDDIQRKYLKFREKQLVETLRKRKGICDDYSHLFQAMCEAVGVKAVVISGISRRWERPFKKTSQRSSHAWNAIQIDGQWHLVDATWAAGSTDEEVKRFTFEFKPGYFMTPPHYFILDHFPKEESWQLLKTPVSLKEFHKQPVISYGSASFKLTDFTSALKSDADKRAEVRLRFAGEPPTAFLIGDSQGQIISKPIVKKEEDGWLSLLFPRPKGQEVVIMVGQENSRKIDILARYLND